MRIYKSPIADIDIPVDLTLSELLLTSARSPPLPESHIIAVDDIESRTLTLGQLRSTAGQLASGLKSHFNPRDQSRWAVILPNSVAYFEACHAVLWLGGIFCPINHQLKAGEIAHALAVSKPEYVIAFSQVVAKVAEAVNLAKVKSPGLQSPKIIVAIGSAPGYSSLSDFRARTPLALAHCTDTRSRLASIHLSSGTTGNPKGVGLSHYNYVANVLQMWYQDPDRWGADQNMVQFTPFVHIANTTIPLFISPWTGYRNTIMASFELEAFAKVVQDSKATAIQVSPAIAFAIADTDLTRRYDFSNLKYMFHGPFPLQGDAIERFMAKGNWTTASLYGMTEAAPYVVHSKISERLPLGKVGTLLPNMTARLRLEDGSDAPEGGPGELWLKGPNMTKGYVDNPEANKTAFDQDGWYNTGDVCTFTEKGWFEVVGRTKELIKYSGFQVSPTELESYINSHPDVADSAVGALWDKQKLNELPTAYVVLKPKLETTAEKMNALESIQESVNSQVSGYKKLRGGVWEVTELPRNANLKFLRKQLGMHKTGIYSAFRNSRSAKI